MRLILVRHGETVENKTGIIQGHQQGTLTEEGKDQARKAAKRLQYEPIHLIISSDLQRTRDTTAEIAKFHHVPVIYTDEVRERNWGVLDGQPRSVVHETIEASGKDFAEFKPEGGESVAEFWARAERFLAKMRTQYAGRAVLLVTHNGFIRAVIGLATGKSIEDVHALDFRNASITIVEFSGEKATVQTFE